MQKDTKKTDRTMLFAVTTGPKQLEEVIARIGSAAKVRQFDVNPNDGSIQTVFKTTEAIAQRMNSASFNVKAVETCQSRPDCTIVSLTDKKADLMLAAVDQNLDTNPKLSQALDAIFDATYDEEDNTLFGDETGQTQAVYNGTGQGSRALLARTASRLWVQISDLTESADFGITNDVVAIGINGETRVDGESTEAIVQAVDSGEEVNWDVVATLPSLLAGFGRGTENNLPLNLQDPSTGKITLMLADLSTNIEGTPTFEITDENPVAVDDVVIGLTGADDDTDTIAYRGDTNSGPNLRKRAQVPAFVWQLAAQASGLNTDINEASASV